MNDELKKKKFDIIEGDFIYSREYWNGDSRDGSLVNGDGFHFYKMTRDGTIVEAFEYYELDDGRECVTPLPEMKNINWYHDLGFEDLEILDPIKESDYDRIRELSQNGR